MNEKLNQFLNERRAALASLDRDQILDYLTRYNLGVPRNEKNFWKWVHQARSGMLSLHPDKRRESHNWLMENGYKSFFTE